MTDPVTLAAALAALLAAEPDIQTCGQRPNPCPVTLDELRSAVDQAIEEKRALSDGPER